MSRFTSLDVRLEGDGAFSDYKVESISRLDRVALLTEATEGGNPVIVLGIICEDGTQILAQTTWNLFYNAAVAIKARLEVT
jgi:hypothetical protein